MEKEEVYFLDPIPREFLTFCFQPKQYPEYTFLANREGELILKVVVGLYYS